MNRSAAAQLRCFWREDGIFLTLMLALFALRFWPAFAHGALYAPFQDNLWLYGPLFSRASEIALTGNFPYWLDTVLGGFPLYQTPHFSVTYPFYFFGLLNYGKAFEVFYTLSYVTCFHTLVLYLNLYVMLRVAGAGGLASLCGATVGLVSGNTEISATLDRDSCCLELVPVVSCRNDSHVTRATFLQKYCAVFAFSRSDVCC